MTGIEMKYFVLKPQSKGRDDYYAIASQTAMVAYADAIEVTNLDLAEELREWAAKEATKTALEGKT